MKFRAVSQLLYAVLFASLALAPNLATRPSILLVVAAVLTAVWLFGGVGLLFGMWRADELMLCGAFAPVLVGVTQWVYRIHFILTYGGLTHESAPESTSAGFVLVGVLETLLVLIPGLIFVVWNIRRLTPVPEGLPPQAIARRPSSRRRRT